MICSRCSREIPDDARLCCYCGRVFERRAARRSRANGEGYVYQRGKSWYCRVTVGWVERPGQRPLQLYRTKGGFRTRAEAAAYAPQLLAQAEVRQVPLLASYWETYSRGEMARLSDSKRTAYQIAWRRLAPLHHLRVDAITVQDLRDAVSASASTYYPARDCKQLLRNLFRLAAADRWASADLPGFILLPPLQEEKREAFTADEVAALWALYASGDLDAALPLVMIYTGMMPGELQQLRPEMIDYDAQQIIGAGLKTKVRKSSAIVFPSDLISVFRSLAAASTSTSGYLLPRNEGAFYTRYYAALSAAGCRRLSPYSCRHTTATALAIDHQIPAQTIQRVMRWSSTRMLDRYAHPDDQDALAAVSALGTKKAR